MTHKTNTEMVTHLMDYSSRGAVMHMFVLTAIQKYSEMVLAADPETLKCPLFGPGVWVGCAHEAKHAIDQHLDR